MQIVIDINDKVYGLLKYFEESLGLNNKKDDSDDVKTALVRAVINGIPLPKEHGRIGDLDAVMSDISTSINEMTNIGIFVDDEYLWAKLNDAIYNAPTIIEADKAESEE